MPKNAYTSIPTDYPLCVHADCPMAATCLHQLAYTQIGTTNRYLRLANPKRCSKDDKCEYYRNSTPVLYARGFKNLQEKMYPKQYKRFMHRLIGKFGRTAYFERRRGETLLSPKEQQIVLAALREVGIEEKLEFDAYEKNINWYG